MDGRPGAGDATAGPGAPAGFTALASVDPTIRQDVRYATGRSFVGVPVDGYAEPVCLLTRVAARALRGVQRGLLRTGLSLKVYDCYRPQRAVDHFVRWAGDPLDQRTKGEFYPRVAKSRLFAEGWIAERSGHSRGSTVDVSLVELPAGAGRAGSARPGAPCFAPQAERSPDDSVDMGTGFDCFDPLARTADPRVGPGQRENRRKLVAAMEAAGFVNLPQEWWHFTYAAEPYPGTFFDFPVSGGSLRRR
ncbi:M15 family metallopeptidase [Streptomyces sp. ODS05-4]|uniref:M15 family metallopeptidase n=1 Tax=Streptomyces sp. ODS05-4 TaxID=2944939 RepID=UPI002108B5B6|nr:M15 family metallopeptidase [Streptomyces sp. ODS05-4]